MKWIAVNARFAIISTILRWETPLEAISPGVAFDDLPDDSVGPECGAGKDQFEKVHE